MGAWWLAAFCLVLALPATWMAIREWRRWWWLRRDGIEQPIHIQHRWTSQWGIIPHYYLIYEFERITAQDENFHFSQYTQIDSDTWQALEKGQPLHVVYSASHPHYYRLENETTEQLRWSFAAFFSWASTVFFVAVGL